MSAIQLPQPWRPSKGELRFLDREMVEIHLLMPNWQADMLERTARRQGLTTGQLLRHLIHDFCLQQQLQTPLHLTDFDPDDPWASE